MRAGERGDPALLELIREDLIANFGEPFRPGFQAVAVYRFGAWSLRVGTRQHRLVRTLCTLLYKVAEVFVRNFYGIELPRECRVGRRLRIGHQNGIVVSPFAQIGDDCVLRQNVTIGQAVGDGKAPILGDKVDIGAGAVLIGGIRIGTGAHIGPNVVVTRDVPDGATLFAQPPRVISMHPQRGASVEPGNT